ncbi:hypothetical protein [Bordetella sp. 02P26C-1]|uniref:hypothetical protein n=1 Tax=Bordetella sp. 02P26C-1 TaxID=2683195 RepID=UPI00135379FA|nr:hypothetical protein [Bordetella sp. 02P26C-1]MVW80115.1 hypothetical protein [Bordetella sp. 02P26C-1]
MVTIYRRPRAVSPTPEQALTAAPMPASTPAQRTISRDAFTLRLMRLFPITGGLDAGRKLNTDDHQKVIELGASIMHPDPIAGAARLSVWLQFGRGFPLPQPDQVLLDKLADTWNCADPQPMERNGREAFLTLEFLGLPLAGYEATDIVDPLDLLSPKNAGGRDVGEARELPPPTPAYEVRRDAPPVLVPSRPLYRFYGRSKLIDAD